MIVLSNTIVAQNFETYYQNAAENNPQIKAVFNEYYAVLEREHQVSKLPPPNIALGVFILPVETRLGAQRVKLSVGQMFPAFGSLKAKRTLVSKMAAMKLQQAEVLRNELYFEMQNTWYQIAKIKALTNVERETIELLKIVEKITTQKIEVGKASLTHVYQIKLQIKESENAINLLETQLLPLHKTFATILNEDSIELSNIPDTLTLRELLISKDSLENWIIKQNPMLQMIEVKKEAARQKKEVQRTKNRPTFGASLHYTWLTPRTDMNPDGNGRGILMPMFNISVPLYKKQNQARLKEVEFELLALEDQKEYLQDILLLNLEKALANYSAAQLDITHLLGQIELTHQTLDLMLSYYTVEAKNFDDVLKMEQMLLMYQKKLIMSQMKQNMAVVMIEKLFAQPLVAF